VEVCVWRTVASVGQISSAVGTIADCKIGNVVSAERIDPTAFRIKLRNRNGRAGLYLGIVARPGEEEVV
jgi:hypothetical protein